MRTLIVLAVLGVCSALPQGFLMDTPEVQAEKARFNALWAQQAAAAAAAPDIHIYTQQAQAIPSADGTIAETPEVQQATAEFFRAYAAALAATQPRSAAPMSPPAPPAPTTPLRWTGPLAATIPASLPGSKPNIDETADVLAAKAAFAAAYQQQLRAIAPTII